MSLCELRLRIEITKTKGDCEKAKKKHKSPHPRLEGEPDALPILYPLQLFPMLRQHLLHLLMRPLDELFLVCKEFGMNPFDRLNRLVVELNGELLSLECFQECSGVFQCPLDNPRGLRRKHSIS